MTTIVVVNESTVVDEADFAAVVTALQMQVTKDIVPAWGSQCDCELVIQDKTQPMPANAWCLAILDDSDQAGALGYHDLTPAGQPLAKVFAKSDLEDGQRWSVTASHELVEMLVDPDVNRCVLSPDGSRIYILEAADSCEAEAFGYELAGVLVSDFVTPAWFGPATPGAKYDCQGHISEPFQILSGGYIGWLEIGNSSGWQIQTANRDNSHRNSGPEYATKSRWQKRMASRGMWRLSHPKRAQA